MDFSPAVLKPEDVPQFYSAFREVMLDGFEYSFRIQQYFLNKAYSQSNFEFWLKNNYKSIIAAKNGPLTVAGFLVYDSPWGGVLYCRWLGVLKQYRSQGLGKLMIDMFENEARKLGCHKIELASQPTAREFYKSAGLTQEGYRSKSCFGQDQYLFGKVVGEISEEKMETY